MQRYLIATATGILVLTLGGCAVTPVDGSNRHHRHDGWDKKSWNKNHGDDRKKWDRKRDHDRSRWNRDRDDDRNEDRRHWRGKDRYDRR
jgi:hypothetical protein